MKRRTNVPLGCLRAFEAAARLGRMTLAAEELSVTHGAISRQVGQLQVHLGVDLFEGPRNRPVLTGAGATLLQALTPAFGQIDAAIRTVGDTDPTVVDVACFSTLAMRWLIPRLHRFQRAHPTLDIRLLTNERPTAAPTGYRVDVEVTLADSEAVGSRKDTVLFAERLGVVVAPALLGPVQDFKSDQWQKLPRISSRTRPDAWREWAKLAGVALSAAAARKLPSYEHYTFAIEAAASGLGACVVPYHLVADDLANKRLAAPLGFVESGHAYVARRLHERNRSARHFVKWLAREAATFEKKGNSQ